MSSLTALIKLGSNRPLTDEEQRDVSRSRRQWFPQTPMSGLPLANQMSSPWRGAVLSGLTGGLAGAAAGLYGGYKVAPSDPTPASGAPDGSASMTDSVSGPAAPAGMSAGSRWGLGGAAIGGLATGGIAAVMSALKRKATNDAILSTLKHNTPENVELLEHDRNVAGRVGETDPLYGALGSLLKMSQDLVKSAVGPVGPVPRGSMKVQSAATGGIGLIGKAGPQGQSRSGINGLLRAESPHSPATVGRPTPESTLASRPTQSANSLPVRPYPNRTASPRRPFISPERPYGITPEEAAVQAPPLPSVLPPALLGGLPRTPRGSAVAPLPGQVKTSADALEKLADDLKKKKKPSAEPAVVPPSSVPWNLASAGLGLAGAASLGAARGFGSEQNVADAIAGFDRMNQPLRPNTTMLTQYADSMNAATQLNPYGIPVPELMPWLRSHPKVMGGYPDPVTGAAVPTPIVDLESWSAGGPGLKEKIPTQTIVQFLKQRLAGVLRGKAPDVAGFLQHGVNIPTYTANTPELLHGARAHYGAFRQGPVAAVSHMMRGPRAAGVVQDPSLTGGKPTTYNEYFTPRLEKFVAQRTKNGLLPNEFDTRYMPAAEQTKLLQDFHASLSPAEQAEKNRLETTDMLNLRDSNTANYRPAIGGLAMVQKALARAGYTAGGAGAGGLLGNALYRYAVPGADRSTLGHALSTGAGAGLGGWAGNWASSDQGRESIGKGYEAVKQLLHLGQAKTGSDVLELTPFAQGFLDRCRRDGIGSDAAYDLLKSAADELGSEIWQEAYPALWKLAGESLGFRTGRAAMSGIEDIASSAAASVSNPPNRPVHGIGVRLGQAVARGAPDASARPPVEATIGAAPPATKVPTALPDKPVFSGAMSPSSVKPGVIGRSQPARTVASMHSPASRSIPMVTGYVPERLRGPEPDPLANAPDKPWYRGPVDGAVGGVMSGIGAIGAGGAAILEPNARRILPSMGDAIHSFRDSMLEWNRTGAEQALRPSKSTALNDELSRGTQSLVPDRMPDGSVDPTSGRNYPVAAGISNAGEGAADLAAQTGLMGGVGKGINMLRGGASKLINRAMLSFPALSQVGQSATNHLYNTSEQGGHAGATRAIQDAIGEDVTIEELPALLAEARRASSGGGNLLSQARELADNTKQEISQGVNQQGQEFLTKGQAIGDDTVARVKAEVDRGLAQVDAFKKTGFGGFFGESGLGTVIGGFADKILGPLVGQEHLAKMPIWAKLAILLGGATALGGGLSGNNQMGMMGLLAAGGGLFGPQLYNQMTGGAKPEAPPTEPTTGTGQPLPAAMTKATQLTNASAGKGLPAAASPAASAVPPAAQPMEPGSTLRAGS